MGATDQVREQTILGQRAPAAVRSWLSRYRLHAENAPVHLPANDQLHMQRRLCLPVREGAELLGFLWFVEGREPMDEDSVALAQSSLPAIAELLRAQKLSTGTQLTSVLEKLLAGHRPEPADMEVCAAAGLDAGEPIRVLAATGRSPTADPWSATLEAVARRAGAGVVLSLPLEMMVAVVVSGLTQGVEAAPLPAGTGLGLGDEVGSVAELRDGVRTAIDAAACAAVFEETGGFVDWSRAGLYRMVPLLARDAADAVPFPGIASLFADPRTTTLARTATVYLDLAGNAQATAAALHLHRTSLYYRLERFESLTGVDLREGTQRTAAHLALKVALFRQSASP